VTASRDPLAGGRESPLGVGLLSDGHSVNEELERAGAFPGVSRPGGQGDAYGAAEAARKMKFGSVDKTGRSGAVRHHPIGLKVVGVLWECTQAS